MTQMNYDSPAWSKDDHLALSDETERSRRGLIIGVAIAVVLALIIGWYVFHKKPAAKPQVEQLPSVSVGTPGHQLVVRTISATGSPVAGSSTTMRWPLAESDQRPPMKFCHWDLIDIETPR